MITTKNLCWVSMCTILCCICLCDSQNITLYEYQKKYEASLCTRGLRFDDDDAIIIRGMADFKDNSNISNIYIQYNNTSTDFGTLCHISDLNETSGKTWGSCTFSIVDSIIYINISLKASQILSGATLRAYAVTRYNDKFTSNDVMLPELHRNKSSTSPIILVNGEEIDLLNKIINVSGPNLTIYAFCDWENAPCGIDITANDSAVVEKNKQYALYKQTFAKSTQIFVTLKEPACSLKGFNIFEFEVKIDVQEKADDSTAVILIIVLSCLLGITWLSIIIVFIVKCFQPKKQLTYKEESTDFKKVYQEEQEPELRKLMAVSSPYRGTSDEESPFQLGAMCHRDNSGAVTANTVDLDVHTDQDV